MAELWSREARITVDTIEIEQLDVSFNVVKTLSKEPNTAEVRVYNLNPDQRARLAAKDKPVMRVEAGYGADVGQLFYGVAREVYSHQEGADWVTVLASGDGEDTIQRARVNRSFPPGTNIAVVLQALASEIKVDIGNAIVELQRAGKLVETAGTFLNGTVVSGRAASEIDGLLKSAEVEWSIQDGAFQLLQLGQFLQGLAVHLSRDTGMVGSPSLGSDGILRVNSLLNYAITPGRQLFVESNALPPAFYRVTRTEAVGDRSGGDWYTRIEAEVLA